MTGIIRECLCSQRPLDFLQRSIHMAAICFIAAMIRMT
jgi:hypothetical protein